MSITIDDKISFEQLRNELYKIDRYHIDHKIINPHFSVKPIERQKIQFVSKLFGFSFIRQIVYRFFKKWGQYMITLTTN